MDVEKARVIAALRVLAAAEEEEDAREGIRCSSCSKEEEFCLLVRLWRVCVRRSQPAREMIKPYLLDNVPV